MQLLHMKPCIITYMKPESVNDSAVFLGIWIKESNTYYKTCSAQKEIFQVISVWSSHELSRRPSHLPLKFTRGFNTLFVESYLVSAIQRLRYKKGENHNCRQRRGGLLLSNPDLINTGILEVLKETGNVFLEIP